MARKSPPPHNPDDRSREEPEHPDEVVPLGEGIESTEPSPSDEALEAWSVEAEEVLPVDVVEDVSAEDIIEIVEEEEPTEAAPANLVEETEETPALAHPVEATVPEETGEEISEEDILTILGESSTPTGEPPTGEYFPSAEGEEALPVEGVEDEIIAITDEVGAAPPEPPTPPKGWARPVILTSEAEHDPTEGLIGPTVPGLLETAGGSKPPRVIPPETHSDEISLGAVPGDHESPTGEYLPPEPPTGDYVFEEMAPVEPITDTHTPPAESLGEAPAVEEPATEGLAELFGSAEEVEEVEEATPPTPEAEAPADLLTPEDVSAGFLLTGEPVDELVEEAASVSAAPEEVTAEAEGFEPEVSELEVLESEVTEADVLEPEVADSTFLVPEITEGESDSSLDLASLLGERTPSESGAESALVIEPPALDLGLTRPTETSGEPSSSVLAGLTDAPKAAPAESPVPPLAKPAADLDLSAFPRLSLEESESSEPVEATSGNSSVSLGEPAPEIPGLLEVEEPDHELVDVFPASGVLEATEDALVDEMAAPVVMPSSGSIEITDDALVDELDEVPPPPSSGAIDLTEEVVVDEAPELVPAPSSGAIDITEDALVEETPEAVPPPSSGAIDITEEMVVEEAPELASAPSSGSLDRTEKSVAAGPEAVPAPPSSSVDVSDSDLVSETPSDILLRETAEAHDAPDEDFIDDEILVEGGSEISLSGRPAHKSVRPSGIDIVEELESGVGLPPPEIASSGDLSGKDELDELDELDDIGMEHVSDPADTESSAVDLGSSASFAVPSGLGGHPMFSGEEGEEGPTELSSKKELADLETTAAFEEMPAKSGTALESTVAFSPDEAESASAPPSSDIAMIDESLLEGEEEPLERVPAPHRRKPVAVDEDVLLEPETESGEVEVDESLLVDEETAGEGDLEVDEDMLVSGAASDLEVDEGDLLPEGAEDELPDFEPEEEEDISEPEPVRGGRLSGRKAAPSKKAPPGRKTSLKAGKKFHDEEEEDFASEYEEPEDDVEPDEEELAVAGAGAKKKGGKGGRGGRGEEPAKPKYGRRLFAGFLLATLLIGGGVAATPFVPEAKNYIVQNLYGVDPNPAPKTVGVELTELQKARTQMDQKEFDAALATLAGASKAEELAARGEARWLKYLQEQTEKDAQLNPTDAPVEEALKDIKAAQNKLLEKQIVGTLALANKKGIDEQLTKLQGTDRALRDLLTKGKAIPPDDPDLKDLPKAVGEVVALRTQQASQLSALAKALNVDDPSKLKAAEVETLFKNLGESKKVLEEVTKSLKVKEDEAVKTIEKLQQDRKNLDETLVKVNEKLKDGKVDKMGPDGVADLLARRDDLQAKRDALEKAVREAMKELRDGKAVPPNADLTKEVIQDAIVAREKGQSPLVNSLSTVASSFSGVASTASTFVQQAMERGNLETQLKFYQAREPLIQRPEQKLDTWVALFQDRDTKNPRALAQAEKDLRWVLDSKSGAPPEAKAKAVYLESLLARSEHKWDEARKLLQQSITQGNELPIRPMWMAHCTQTLKELQDPAVYYLPRAQKFQSAGDLPAALRELDLGLQVLPNEPHLLALRSHVRLDLAQATGKIDANDAAAITRDAQAASKDATTAASAYFALGRLAEELNQLDKAETEYRQALKAHKGNAEERGVYLGALGRILQRDRTPVAAPPVPNGKGKAPEISRLSSEEESEPAEKELVEALVLTTLIAAQPVPVVEDEDDEKTVARLKESIELAKELLKSKDRKLQGQGHLLLGKAYSRMGKRTEGLFEYIEGLKKLHPGASTADLAKLLEQHPAFQQPDSSLQPSPVLAEIHFGKGLHYFWDGEYPRAEQQFRKAVEYFNKDARYQYFMGLAQLNQKTTVKRDAAHYSFEQGARLEAQSLPSTVDVNSSLERIQGPVRIYLNRFRQKALVGD